MDLKLFFSAMTSREQLASAYLATLLHHQPSVRGAFFDVVADAVEPARRGLVEQLRGRDWEARTEVDQLDISLRAKDGTARLIIENKLLASSRQHGQLLRYHATFARKASSVGVMAGAIYLAPAGVDTSEVKAVLESEGFQSRKTDFACQISWEDLGEALDKVQTSPEVHWFLASGLTEIRDAIKKGKIEKWPAVGERKVVKDVVTEVRTRLLQAFPALRLMDPWPDRESYVVVTARTNLTMWLLVKFKAGAEKPHPPIDLMDDEGHLRLTIGAQLKISANGTKVPEAKRRWEDVKRAGGLEIKDFGRLLIPDLLT